ncbi:unnamed protein product [Protopolystoma xenopodis]|uniref:Uncharacterized protein n=1 Tax=Protopolystoma xenopodis TaxID=117903 RepID=A0A3S4ZWB4_9PLAT|nr:unnamed protein product [Protopolystoma xenopodis]
MTKDSLNYFLIKKKKQLLAGFTSEGGASAGEHYPILGAGFEKTLSFGVDFAPANNSIKEKQANRAAACVQM